MGKFNYLFDACVSHYNTQRGSPVTELDIELTAACNRLRVMIRNEQQLEYNAEKWEAMAKTSTIQRRIKNEVKNIQVNVSSDRQ